MNKRLFASVITLIVCVFMLSTVALAAAPTYDIATQTISFGEDGYKTDEEYVTLLAFMVPDGTTTDQVTYTGSEKVVAIEQIAGETGFSTIQLAADNVTAGMDIAVLVGGSDTSNATPYVLETAAAPVTYTITIDYGYDIADGSATVEAGTTYADALGADPTREADSANTYAFAGWYTDEECTVALDTTATVTADATVYAKWDATPIQTAVTVTVKNGAEDIVLTADEDGNITLPTTATFDKTMVSEDYKMTLYSWIVVDADGNEGMEYEVSAGTTVAADDLKDVTLYAKYVCNITYGDVNGDGDINSSDYGDVLRVATGKSARRLTGKPLFEGSTIRLGDVLVDDDINSSDYGDILRVATGKSARRQTGKPIYYTYYIQNN